MSQLNGCLKVVSATILLVCFVNLTHHWLKKGKCFYFFLKALFVLEIIKFKPFRYSNVMMSSNVEGNRI